MKANKERFINIEIQDQGNIGVISLGRVDTLSPETRQAEYFHKVINKKLPKILEGHFDYEIKIIQLVVVSILGYIKINGKVRILDCHEEEECSIEEITLLETWVY
jgi:hypothetical protein